MQKNYDHEILKKANKRKKTMCFSYIYFKSHSLFPHPGPDKNILYYLILEW